MAAERICRRCLLREMDGSYFDSIYKYIESIPQEQKASRDEYALRLAKCKGCAYLQNGMCAQCGCFVEVRAAKAKMKCPRGFWEAEGKNESEGVS